MFFFFFCYASFNGRTRTTDRNGKQKEHHQHTSGGFDILHFPHKLCFIFNTFRQRMQGKKSIRRNGPNDTMMDVFFFVNQRDTDTKVQMDLKDSCQVLNLKGLSVFSG